MCIFAHSPDDTTALTLLLHKIHVGFGFNFLVPDHLGCPRQNPDSHKTALVVVVVVTNYDLQVMTSCTISRLLIHNTHTQTHTHTNILRPSCILSGTTRVSRHQKGKSNLDLLEQEIVSGSGISWAICKSVP